MTFARPLHAAVLIVSTFLVLAGASLAAASDVSSIPEYRLEVGQELVYRGIGEDVHEGGTILYAQAWRLFAIDQRPDGTWRLLVRQTSSHAQAEKNADVEEAKKKLVGELDELDRGEKTSSQARTVFGKFDFNRFGQSSNASGVTYMYPSLSNLLASLPQTATQAKEGWQVHHEGQDQTFHSRLIRGSAPDIDLIESTVESVQNDLYELVTKITAKFDRTRGLPVQITSQSEQGFGLKGTSTSSVELVEVKRHSLDWTKRCATEAANCFSVIDEFDRISETDDMDPKELQSKLATCLEDLEHVIATLQTDELKVTMQAQAAKWKDEIGWHVSSAEERVAIIGKPALDWETTDLAGKSYSLKDFRGKVVILDFWYRGCGWCIRAMPQVVAVSQHFKNQPVAVLGMNKHDTLEVAQPVIDKLKLDYPQLQANKISDDYKIHGFPTLLILDQEGVVRDVHIGYSPKSKDKVIHSVESLAKTKLP